MPRDINLRVSNAQAVTATAVSASSFDQGANRDFGSGEKVGVEFTAGADATAAGAATVTFEVIQADDELLTSNVEVIGSTDPIPIAEITAANFYRVVLASPQNGVGRRFIGARYVVATGPLTGGNFTAYVGFGHNRQAVAQYPSGYVAP